MKVKEIIELLSKLDQEATVFTTDQESDWGEGATPIYPARRRVFFPANPHIEGYNVWSEWGDTESDKPYESSRLEVQLTSDKPLYYILGSWG